MFLAFTLRYFYKHILFPKHAIKRQACPLPTHLTVLSAKLLGGQTPSIGVSSRHGLQAPSHWWIMARWGRDYKWALSWKHCQSTGRVPISGAARFTLLGIEGHLEKIIDIDYPVQKALGIECVSKNISAYVAVYMRLKCYIPWREISSPSIATLSRDSVCLIIASSDIVCGAIEFLASSPVQTPASNK
ncbi:hypothetical protein JTE90_010725 [Oedothorax gibbosus]|uniref:Uncharacterized protein n=1 Tax=Oedothorax gibbosus TaxID=931172 RepID=A0AAV6UPD5_9ARAC|nr:hypothetical protein JTE90_010725 [Oedothorax gibbosus]